MRLRASPEGLVSSVFKLKVAPFTSKCLNRSVRPFLRDGGTARLERCNPINLRKRGRRVHAEARPHHAFPKRGQIDKRARREKS